MRRLRLTLFLSSAVVFSGAIAFGNQGTDKKAEEQFKNIVSFKGASASEILPAMNFMSASLGVDCNFCHTQKGFDSDEKKEKGTTREMIAMTRDINAKNFGGGNQVTCFTCHGGHSQPTSTPPVLTVSRRFRRDAAMKADDILMKYRTAIGGDPALSSLKTVHLTGTVTMGTNSIPFEAYQASPSKFLLDVKAPGGEQKIGFNGIDTWVSQPRGVRKQTGANAQRLQRMGRFFRDSASIPMFETTTLGTAVVDGKTLNVLRGTRPTDHETDVFYFDPQSGLLSRVVYYSNTILGDLPEVYDYADYRKVGEVMVPFKVTQTGSNGSTVRQITNAEPNAQVDGTVFDTPSK